MNIARKVYVDVNVDFTKEGKVIPHRVSWIDGRVFEIDRVTEIRSAASRAGGMGLRYTCIIDGQRSHLFFEDRKRWFVEGYCAAEAI